MNRFKVMRKVARERRLAAFAAKVQRRMAALKAETGLIVSDAPVQPTEDTAVK